MVRRSERVNFPGGTGSDLSGIIDLPDDAPKATAIFTHCFTCSKDLKAVVRISRGLAEKGFGVLRYDLTGLGGSHGDFSKTSFTTNRQDLNEAIAFLSRHLAPPSFLIGHSFGGACSLSIAQDSPSVRGVVSLAAPSDTRHLADLLVRMDPEIASKGVGTVSIGGRQYQICKSMIEDFRAFDLPALLRKLSKPTLLLHSPVDETLGYEHVLRLFSLLTQRSETDPPASPTSLICLPDADHLLVKKQADLDFVVDLAAAWFHRILAEPM